MASEWVAMAFAAHDVQLMREACARSMSSGLVLSSILIRPDMELFGEHNEDS